MKTIAESTDPIREVREWKSQIGRVPGGITRVFLPLLTPEQTEKRKRDIAAAGMLLIQEAEAKNKGESS